MQLLCLCRFDLKYKIALRSIASHTRCFSGIYGLQDKRSFKDKCVQKFLYAKRLSGLKVFLWENFAVFKECAEILYIQKVLWIYLEKMHYIFFLRSNIWIPDNKSMLYYYPLIDFSNIHASGNKLKKEKLLNIFSSLILKNCLRNETPGAL